MTYSTVFDFNAYLAECGRHPAWNRPVPTIPLHLTGSVRWLAEQKRREEQDRRAYIRSAVLAARAARLMGDNRSAAHYLTRAGDVRRGRMTALFWKPLSGGPVNFDFYGLEAIKTRRKAEKHAKRRAQVYAWPLVDAKVYGERLAFGAAA